MKPYPYVQVSLALLLFMSAIVMTFQVSHKLAAALLCLAIARAIMSKL